MMMNEFYYILPIYKNHNDTCFLNGLRPLSANKHKKFAFDLPKIIIITILVSVK